MIEEYAVDPELFLDFNTFKFVMGHFGFQEGRLLARFPRKWAKQVISQLYEHRQNYRINETHADFITDWIMKEASDFSVDGKWNYDESCKWIENAVREKDKFHLILTTENNKNNNDEKIFRINEYTRKEDNSLFHSNSSKMPKTVKGFGKAGGNLLKHTKERVILIDPNLVRSNRTKGFAQALEEFFRHIPREIDDIRYITTFEITPNPEKNYPEKWIADQPAIYKSKIENLKKEFQYYIPAGRNVKIQVLDVHNRLNDGIDKHNRYIVNDRAAILFPYGLDVMQEKTDVPSILPEGDYEEIYAQMSALTDEQLCEPAFQIYGK